MYMEVTYKNGNFMWLTILYSISCTILIIILLTKSYAIYMVNILPILLVSGLHTPSLNTYLSPFLLYFHSTFSVDCIQ